MNTQDYEQKRAECWEEFLRSCCELNMPRSKFLFDWTFDRAYSLGKQEKDADTVIHGWVARDLDGEVFLYENKPERGDGEWLGRISSEFDFQQLKWGSDPIEVELIIKRKKK